ncbi:MAG: hypothetical protein Q8N83_13330 [Ignavibacteria bacterium]|nr:hypothetical protein [Ignavibacteria bacterium]
MTIENLRKRLIEECFNEDYYHIGDHWKFKSDVYVLANPYGTWDIFYSERGNDNPSIKSFIELEDACEYFYQFLNSDKHLKAHTLETFESKDEADNIISKLIANGIHPELSSIPIMFIKVNIGLLFLVMNL